MHRDMFVFAGIDGQKTLEDARKKSAVDSVIVHLHGLPRKCQDYKHVMYENSQQVDEWGTVDGSASPSQL